MARCREACTNAGERAGEAGFIVADQSVGVGCVLLRIAVAGDKQVVGQWPSNALRPGDEGAAVPFDQAFVLPAHALPATTGEQQD